LLTAIGLTPGGSSTVHIYTQTIQLTTMVGRLSGIRTQPGQTKINDELCKNHRLMGRVRAVPRLCDLYPGEFDVCVTVHQVRLVNFISWHLPLPKPSKGKPSFEGTVVLTLGTYVTILLRIYFLFLCSVTHNAY